MVRDSAEVPAMRIEEREREKNRLLPIIDIPQGILGTLRFTDIPQSIARRLGEAFGLDRASIFLADRGAIETGDTVFIADATSALSVAPPVGGDGGPACPEATS